jgi:hypothetical protein
MIFITGFHHSGTSFLARAVEQLGVNFGGPLDRHHEHEELKKLDDQIIGDWQKPDIANANLYMGTPVPEGTEAYKNPRLMVTGFVWHRNFPGAKWIVINRKQNDVVCSMMRDPERSQDPRHWDRLIEEYGQYWLAFTVARRLDMLHVSYRDLCEYPELTAARLGHFIGRPEKIAEVGAWIAQEARHKTYARTAA